MSVVVVSRAVVAAVLGVAMAVAGLVWPTAANAVLPANGVKDVTSSMSTSSFVPGFTLGVSPDINYSWASQNGSPQNPGLSLDTAYQAQTGYFDVAANGTDLARFDLTALTFVDFNHYADHSFTVVGTKPNGSTVSTSFTKSYTSTTYTAGNYAAFTGLTGFRVTITDVGNTGQLGENVFDSFTIANATAPGPSSSSDATLSALVLGAGTLSPAFAAGTTSYSAAVPNSTTSTTVQPTVAESHATVTVNGTTISSGSPSGTIALAVGSNTITTVVTAQDGATTRTYTVTVTRASVSNDATLYGLVLSNGTLSPAFSPGATSYTAGVPTTTTSITVTATTNQAAATVTVNGVTVTSGSPSGAVALAVGSNTISTVVTAQDGSTTRTYTVTVTRAAPPSTVATLSSLTLGAGALSPAFASGTTGYTASVTHGTTSTTVTPTVTDSSASVTVNGVAVTSGNASGAVALAVGANTVTTVVTAQDGSTTRSYTVTITRAASGNSALTGLVLSTGSLSPSFASGTTSYTASVGYTTSSMTLTPTVADPGATVTVAGTTTSSGSPSAAIPLTPGSNPVAVVVTAPDGSTRTYTVTVSRQPASTTAALSGLTSSAGPLSPGFSSSVTGYTATVAHGIGSVTVTPTVSDPAASVTVAGSAVSSGSASGAVPVAVGTTTISVVVTAQDGTTTTTYTLAVTRLASADATLSALAVPGVSTTPAFTPGTLVYTAAVPNATASMTVLPTVAVPGAVVTVQGTVVASGSPSGPLALAVGSTTVTVRVTAPDGTTVRDYVLTITRPGLPPTFTDVSIGALQVGTPVQDAVHAMGTPTITYAVSAGALPTGLLLDPASGAVTGVPVTSGAYTVDVTATNALGTATTQLTGTVAAAPTTVLQLVSTLRVGSPSADAQVSFTVLGAVPGSTVVATLHSDPVRLYTGSVGGSGTLGATVVLPAGIPTGAHRVQVDVTAPDGHLTSGAVWFSEQGDDTVGAVSTAGPVGPDPTGALASTGPTVDLVAATGLGLVLLVVGGLLVGWRRRV